MILIAPDKFKGTLTAKEAAEIIANALRPARCLMMPMADGGEGTAEILGRGPEWEVRDCYRVEPRSRTAVIDSSAVIGLRARAAATDILKASSAPLGVKVREILKGGCDTVIIGIGGTGTCDGGAGFIEALGEEKLAQYKDSIIGLSDVSVPLVAADGQPSALMFAPQKGATDSDMQVMRQRLERMYSRYPQRTPYDGAGGGLGFAIAGIIGARCYCGAEYVLNQYNINWRDISLVVTGEGRIDEQTAQGKVVETVRRAATARGIPVLAIGGSVADGMESPMVVSTSHYLPELPLNKDTAARRLGLAVREWVHSASSGFGESGSVYHFE